MYISLFFLSYMYIQYLCTPIYTYTRARLRDQQIADPHFFPFFFLLPFFLPSLNKNKNKPNQTKQNKQTITKQPTKIKTKIQTKTQTKQNKTKQIKTQYSKTNQYETKQNITTTWREGQKKEEKGGRTRQTDRKQRKARPAGKGPKHEGVPVAAAVAVARPPHPETQPGSRQTDSKPDSRREGRR